MVGLFLAPRIISVDRRSRTTAECAIPGGLFGFEQRADASGAGGARRMDKKKAKRRLHFAGGRVLYCLNLTFTNCPLTRCESWS